MEDIAPKLADELLSAYKKAISKVLKKYEKYIKQGSVSYETAHDFSLEAYGIAFNEVKKTLRPEVLPDERLYFNIAERTLKPLIEQGCNDIADYCKKVQQQMNHDLGLKIKPSNIPLENDRIDDIVSHAANIEKFDDVIDKIGYSMENLYQHVVDESIRRNADTHYKLGLKPKIIRIAESKCCEWCSNLEGTYDYADVSNKGNDVFRRHRNCRCIVLYEEKKGNKYEVTNVHTKKTSVIVENTQNYKKVLRGNKDSALYKDKKIDVYKVEGYKNVYLEANTIVKPKALHEINRNINEAIHEYNITNIGNFKIVVADKETLDKSLGSYDAINNILYIDSKITDETYVTYYGGALGQTERHEVWHLKQARNYIAKGNTITKEGYADYISELCARSKLKVEKLGIDEYNVGEISEYAKKMYRQDRYDEVEAEYMSIKRK